MRRLLKPSPWFRLAVFFKLAEKNLGEAMFQRIHGNRNQNLNPISTIGKLNETLELLERRESFLVNKAAAEIEKAKDFTSTKNKKAAIQCLKKKRLYEQQIEQLGNFQLHVHDQMILLETAKSTTETVDALRDGAAAMNSMNKARNINEVEKIIDEMNEQTDNLKQIQGALSAPSGAAADFDEDELEAELEELEEAELEDHLLQPAMASPEASVTIPPEKLLDRQEPRMNAAEEDELTVLQAEMTL